MPPPYSVARGSAIEPRGAVQEEGGSRRLGLAALLQALPADVRRLRAARPGLARELRAAGVDVDDDGTVELAESAGELDGCCETAVVVVSGQAADRGRLGSLARLPTVLPRLVRARREAAALRRRGYPHVAIWQWRIEREIPRAPVSVPLGRGATAVVGGRRPLAPSLLDVVVAVAERRSGRVLSTAPTLARRSGVLILAPDAVARVSVGNGAALVRAQVRALDLVRSAHPPAAVLRRLSRVLAHGELALAAWSVEERLPGRQANALDERLLGQCVEFAAALHGTGVAGDAGPSLLAHAESVARFCADGEGERLLAVAASVGGALAGIPLGLGHGDFWTENLLVDGDRLVGVVDWSSGSAEALPFLDVMHLLVSAQRLERSLPLGAAVAGWLLPRVAGGAFGALRDYGRAIGLEPDAATLRALALAYWLAHSGRQVAAYAGVIDLRRWTEINVLPMLAAIR